MKHLLLTTIAAVMLVGCGESQPSESPTAESSDIPIHDAATDGNIEAVKQHLAAGVDVNAKDGDWTPLHIAALNGRKEIAELLIVEGADVNAKVVSGPKQGLTPLDAANETNHPETADLLRKHGGKTGAELKAEGKPSSTYLVRIIQSYDIRILKSPDDDTQYILEPAQVTLELGSNAVPVPDLTSPSVVKVVLDATDIPAGINETNKQVRVLVPEGTIIKGINPENVKVTRVVEYPEMPKPRIPQR